MASSVADIYSDGLAFVSSVLDQFPDEAWERPSPCTGWRAIDVLGHLGTTTEFGIELLAGKQPTWNPSPTPGDSVEGSPKDWWQELATKADQATSEADLTKTVNTPAGPRSITDGLRFPALDLFIHSWDIARAAGIDITIPAEAIKFAHAMLDPIPDEQLRSPATFAPEVAVSDDASPTDTFIAWTGRDPKWSEPES